MMIERVLPLSVCPVSIDTPDKPDTDSCTKPDKPDENRTQSGHKADRDASDGS